MKLRHLEYTFSQIENKKIVIIGDVMLDKYIYGNVERISPEVPVPIVEIQKEEYKLGGAANVALNIKKLGAEPIILTVIGNDDDGEILQEVLYREDISTNYFLFEANKKTTCKTRIMSDTHQILRLDSEEKSDISQYSEYEFIKTLNDLKDSFEIILLQDYNKGVLSKSLIHKILEFSKLNNKKILVDPKLNNFFEYKDVFLFKPNKKELKNAIQKPFDTYEQQIVESSIFMKKINCENLVVTLSQDGMLLLNNKNDKINIEKIPTLVKKVADVSGAGDTVISVIAVLLNSELELFEILNIANIAAGMVVEEVGIVAVTKEKLIEHVDKLIKQEYLQ